MPMLVGLRRAADSGTIPTREAMIFCSGQHQSVGAEVDGLQAQRINRADRAARVRPFYNDQYKQT